ncbi:MAG: RQC-minor-1 family DNA-binding protein [Thermodesulfobacteriota bacterium]
MGRKKTRFKYHLDPKGIKNLPIDEIKSILRGADDLIMRGGRTLLAKVLKGSREKKVIELGLDKSPVYGYYKTHSTDEILARIDWVILNGYLDIEYDNRLPLLVYTPKGWEIEKDIYAEELIRGLDEILASGSGPFDMSYLKDKNRELIWLLLEKVEATGSDKYIPLLEEWEKIDYRKVRQKIKKVIDALNKVVA